MGNYLGLAATVLTLVGSAAHAVDHRKPRKYDPEAVRCVRLPVTGSLAQKKRICMTNRAWDEQREEARKMQTLTCSNRAQCGGI